MMGLCPPPKFLIINAHRSHVYVRIYMYAFRVKPYSNLTCDVSSHDNVSDACLQDPADDVLDPPQFEFEDFRDEIMRGFDDPG